MKRFVLIPLILTCILVFAVFKSVEFLYDRNNKTPVASIESVQDNKNEEKNENALNDQSEINDKQDDSQDKKEKAVYPDNVYKMLDFDRRLILKIGQQEDETCSIYCLGYARAILDNNYSVDPYRYWDDGAVWRDAGFKDIASSDPLDKVLKKAYDELDRGRPAIIYTTGAYGVTLTDKPQERSASEHFIVLLGYRANADYDNLKASDFYSADPANAYRLTEENYVPWIILKDGAPSLMLNEYALFVPEDPDVHVDVCLAFPDTVKWESESKEIIHPDYYQ